MDDTCTSVRCFKIQTFILQKKIEQEIRTDTSDKLRDAMSTAKDRVATDFEELRKQEYVRKGLEGVSRAAESVSKTAQDISQTEIMQKAKEVSSMRVMLSNLH